MVMGPASPWASVRPFTQTNEFVSDETILFHSSHDCAIDVGTDVQQFDVERMIARLNPPLTHSNYSCG